MIWPVITLTIYLIYIFIKYKQIPKSISETYYLGASWLFTLIMWIMGFSAAGFLIPITPEAYQFLAFFIGAGVVFVGASPHFKEDLEGIVHYVGAYLFAVSATIWSALYYSPEILVCWVWMIPFLFTKQRTFWAEIICISILFLSYLL